MSFDVRCQTLWNLVHVKQDNVIRLNLCKAIELGCVFNKTMKGGYVKIRIANLI